MAHTVIAPRPAPLVPLDSLQTGERGIIADLDGPLGSINRLHELGMRVGEPLRMLRAGPPHLIQIGESRLCFRPESDVIVLIGVGEE